MKAVICTKYGPPEVLQIQEVEKPVPKDNEVLIKIIAATVHVGDTKIRAFRPGLGFIKDLIFKPIMRIIVGFRGPRKNILGMELAGDIEAVGKAVTLFKTGDPIFASTDRNLGAYAEYTCLPEDGVLALKPENMSYSEAAAIPNGGITAIQILKKFQIEKGQKVLIYGASGSVGTFAVQLAVSMGAEVTGVCSTANLEMVKSLGAHKVIDYTQEDFTQNNKTYDVIFDAVGKFPPAKSKKSLTPMGAYNNVLFFSNALKLTQQHILDLKQEIDAGFLKTVIDRTYTLDQIVEAHHYVDKGHKKGHVIITIDDSKS